MSRFHPAMTAGDDGIVSGCAGHTGGIEQFAMTFRRAKPRQRM